MEVELWRAGIAADLATLRSIGAPLAQRLGDRFTVMHGNGNVIGVLDALHDEAVRDPVTTTREICSAMRHVRIDGVSFLTQEDSGQPRMTYFDRDGTWEPMCGNALRCVGQYLFDRRAITGSIGMIDTDDGPREVRLESGTVLACIGEPREFSQVGKDEWFVFTGCAHLVLELTDVERLDVRRLGSRLRHDDDLCCRVGHPEGVHVDFVESTTTGLRVRTYEPGVEDETLACGTGVGASAYAWWSRGELTMPVEVTTRGGQMTVDMDTRGHIWISGVVEYLSGRESDATLGGVVVTEDVAARVEPRPEGVRPQRGEARDEGS